MWHAPIEILDGLYVAEWVGGLISNVTTFYIIYYILQT